MNDEHDVEVREAIEVDDNFRRDTGVNLRPQMRRLAARLDRERWARLAGEREAGR